MSMIEPKDMCNANPPVGGHVGETTLCKLHRCFYEKDHSPTLMHRNANGDVW
jgi:hypothetical protein